MEISTSRGGASWEVHENFLFQDRCNVVFLDLVAIQVYVYKNSSSYILKIGTLYMLSPHVFYTSVEKNSS